MHEAKDFVFWLQNRFQQQVQRMLPSALKFKEVGHVSATQTTDNINYKQLYLQCKQNVAIFMKQVDKEIQNILKNHEEEKKKLQNDIKSLKQQLRNSKNDVSIVVRQNSSFKSIPVKKFSSELKERNNTSVSKQTMDQCLAKLSGFDLKTIISEKRTSTKGSIAEEKSQKAVSLKKLKKNYKEERESDCFTNRLSQGQQTEDLAIEPLRLTSNIPKRRQKRLKEKASAKSEKVESIKDVLRSIRGKLSNDNPRFFRVNEQEQRPVLAVITPQMFNVPKGLKN